MIQFTSQNLLEKNIPVVRKRVNTEEHLTLWRSQSLLMDVTNNAIRRCHQRTRWRYRVKVFVVNRDRVFLVFII